MGRVVRYHNRNQGESEGYAYMISMARSSTPLTNKAQGALWLHNIDDGSVPMSIRIVYRNETNRGWVWHTGPPYWVHHPLSDRTDTRVYFHRTLQLSDIIDHLPPFDRRGARTSNRLNVPSRPPSMSSSQGRHITKACRQV